MLTHTPIPHWMAQPWGEVCAWLGTVAEIQEEDRKAAERG